MEMIRPFRSLRPVTPFGSLQAIQTDIPQIRSEVLPIRPQILAVLADIPQIPLKILTVRSDICSARSVPDILTQVAPIFPYVPQIVPQIATIRSNIPPVLPDVPAVLADITGRQARLGGRGAAQQNTHHKCNTRRSPQCSFHRRPFRRRTTATFRPIRPSPRDRFICPQEVRRGRPKKVTAALKWPTVIQSRGHYGW